MSNVTKRITGARGFVTVGALTGGGGLGSAAAIHRKDKDVSHELAGATVGGWAGQGAYQGAGYAAKWRAQAKKEPQLNRAKRDRALKPVKAQHGAYTPAMERNYPKTLPEWRTHRVLGWTHRGKVGTALGSVVTAGGTFAGVRMTERKRKVSKAMPASALRFLARNKHNIAPPALAASGTAAYGVHEDRSQREVSRSRALGASVAGGAGYGAFKATGLTIRDRAKALERTNLPGQSSSARKKARDNHLKSFGLHPNDPGLRQAMERNPKISRTWPKELANSKYKRVLGHMSGRQGALMEAAAVALPASVVLHGRKKVSKGYGYQEKRTSPLRATEMAAGLTLLGWGGSRLGVVRGTLAAGSRKAGNVGINFRRAEKARAAIEASTGRGAAMLGQHVNTGFRLRPIEGVVGGGFLVNQAHPVRRKQFTPIEQGW